MRAGLDDLVSDTSVGTMKHVPVAQHVRRTSVLVKDDATDGSRRDPLVCNTDSGRNRIQARLAITWCGFCDYGYVGFKIALNDVCRYFDTANHERLWDLYRIERCKGFRSSLGPYGKLDR